MTAKQYLNRVRRIEEDIAELMDTKTRAREAVERMTQNYSGDGAQVTKDPHKFDRLVVLDSLIDDLIDKQIAIKTETLETISKLSDNRMRLLLEKYYINMKSWHQVAREMHYSDSHMRKMHGHALLAVERIIKDDTQ